jgi:hypothetical protein
MADGTRYFQLSPPDLTTAADVSALSVWADAPGPVQVDSLQAVAATISLVTWPEGISVPWTAQYHVAPSSSGRDRFSMILVQPRDQLSPRWYALKVAELGSGMAVRKMTYHGDGVSPGGTMVRFRPDSAPRVVAIIESLKREDPNFPPFPTGFPYLLEVRLSELVKVEDTVAITLTGPGQSDCQRADPHGQVTARVPFYCRSSVLAGLGVSAGPGLSSASHGALDEALIQVDPNGILALGEQVKRYNVDVR